MTARRVLVLGEGPHELGRDLDGPLTAPSLPALPMLVHRCLERPEGVTYACRAFRSVKAVHGRGRNKLAKKVVAAIRAAKREGFAAAVVAIDRDRGSNAERIEALRQGRDRMEYTGCPPCSVGVAVETFDAWMIADPQAVEAAGGDRSVVRSAPESLDGKEGTGQHPKDLAGRALGDGLSDRYAAVAAHADLDVLAEACPQGFRPFAEDIRRRVSPAVST